MNVYLMMTAKLMSTVKVVNALWDVMRTQIAETQPALPVPWQITPVSILSAALMMTVTQPSIVMREPVFMAAMRTPIVRTSLVHSAEQTTCVLTQIAVRTVSVRQ